MSLYRNLTQEQVVLRDTVRRLAEEYINPVAQELDDNEQFSVELTKKFAELGFLGAFLPENYNGTSLDYLSYIILVEEIARVDASQAATIAAQNSFGIAPILLFGTEKQKKKYLPKLAKGNLWSFAVTEYISGSDIGNIETKAEKKGKKNWILSGSKAFVTNASTEISIGSTILALTKNEIIKIPDETINQANKINNQGNETEKQKTKIIKEFTFFLVDRATQGYRATPLKNRLSWRASDISEIIIDECCVPSDNILGNEGDGLKILQTCLDNGRLAVAAIGLGIAQGAFDYALRYAKNRKTFGNPICSHQAIAFKLADIEVGIELARNYLYDACRMLDMGETISKESAVAKLYCSELAQLAAEHCIQILGAYGIMKEYKAERFFRDQRALQIIEGTSELQRMIIARLLGCFDNLNEPIDNTQLPDDTKLQNNSQLQN